MSEELQRGFLLMRIDKVFVNALIASFCGMECRFNPCFVPFSNVEFSAQSPPGRSAHGRAHLCLPCNWLVYEDVAFKLAVERCNHCFVAGLGNIAQGSHKFVKLLRGF